jgi:hypothetical protein
MQYQTLVKLFSAPRMARYLETMNGDEQKATKLYLEQNVFCGNFFSLSSYFEVILRNKINGFMTTNFAPDWLIKISQPNSILNKENTIHTYSSLLEVREKLLKENRLTNDRMIDALAFGFWGGLFQYRQYNDLNGNLLNIFNQAPSNHQRLLYVVHRNINQIRRLRNLIAHNAPIIFAAGENKISFDRTDIIIKRVKELTEWLDVPLDIYDYHLKLLNRQKQIILQIISS